MASYSLKGTDITALDTVGATGSDSDSSGAVAACRAACTKAPSCLFFVLSSSGRCVLKKEPLVGRDGATRATEGGGWCPVRANKMFGNGKHIIVVSSMIACRVTVHHAPD